EIVSRLDIDAPPGLGAALDHGDVDLEHRRPFGPFDWYSAARHAAEIDAEPHPGYLVRRIIAAGDYGILGAAHKAGKTWLAVDLAVAVASGKPWLGIHPVDRPGPVVWFAGEGGKRKL